MVPALEETKLFSRIGVPLRCSPVPQDSLIAALPMQSKCI